MPSVLVFVLALANASGVPLAEDTLESLRADMPRRGQKSEVTPDDLARRCLVFASTANKEEGLEALQLGLRLTLRGSESLDDVFVTTVEKILEGWIDDPNLETVVSRYLVPNARHSAARREATEGFLKVIETKSPHKSVQAASLWTGLYGRMRTHRREPLEGPLKQETVESLRRLQKEYPNAEDSRGRLYSERAESAIFELEKLGIGCVAPDIEGEDTDGVAFKLSDYRGKVVVLDFWGHW